MGKKFLDGYVSLCEGEKDPRNLVLVFAMDRVILIEFDISERVQVSRRHSTSVQNIKSDAITVPVRCDILLLPHHLPTSPKQPWRNYCRRPAVDAKVCLRYSI